MIRWTYRDVYTRLCLLIIIIHRASYYCYVIVSAQCLWEHLACFLPWWHTLSEVTQLWLFGSLWFHIYGLAYTLYFINSAAQDKNISIFKNSTVTTSVFPTTNEYQCSIQLIPYIVIYSLRTVLLLQCLPHTLMSTSVQYNIDPTHHALWATSIYRLHLCDNNCLCQHCYTTTRKNSHPSANTSIAQLYTPITHYTEAPIIMNCLQHCYMTTSKNSHPANLWALGMICADKTKSLN